MSETLQLISPEEEQTPLNEERITRREFLGKMIKVAAGFVIGGAVAKDLVDHIGEYSRETETEAKITTATKERGRNLETDQEVEQAFEQIRQDAVYIRETLSQPKQNFPQGDFKPWAEAIQSEDKWNGNQPDEMIILLNELLSKDLTIQEKRELFEVPDTQIYPTDIKGFEDIGSVGKLQDLLGRMLPPRYFACTHTLNFNPENNSYNGKAHLAKDSHGRFMVDINKTGSVSFGADWKTLNPASRCLLAHETGHNADWEANIYLSTAEKVHLYRMLMDRLHSPERYHSAYVEIKNGLDRDYHTWNDTVNIRNGAQEYWADVCEIYFTGYQRDWGEEWGDPCLPQEDRDLIEWVLARTDPEWLKKRN
ncbi:MAG: hypothetical protein HW405_147 [Candidatus Berkelbacteria bacterium]|nr:hypothetical protein [Candidatus Berkelbacteria bacterium]